MNITPDSSSDTQTYQESHTPSMMSQQINQLVETNNQLKVDNLVLEKQLTSLRKKFRELKSNQKGGKFSSDRDPSRVEDLKKQNSKLEEKMYHLKLKYEELENEHSLLKLNNQFQKKAIFDLE